MNNLKNRLKRQLHRVGLYSNLDKNIINNSSEYLHVGCGEISKVGWINIDQRSTLATNFVTSCTELSETHFRTNQFKIIYSNAFFEHLFKDHQLIHLKSVFRCLNEKGQVLYTGIPDFQIISESYNKNKLTLEDCYRYTHGYPEQARAWWLGQLHKSLFDTKYLSDLLTEAGFEYFNIFRYCFKEEIIPLNLGFLAFKTRPDIEPLIFTDNKSMSDYLREISPDIQKYSVEITDRKL